MKRPLACALLLLGFAAPELRPQGLPTSSIASSATPSPRPAKRDGAQAKDANKTEPAQPIVTEIFADEVFFDSPNHIGIFTGHVIVNDPRFNVQSDKLTVYLSKNAPGSAEEKAPAGPPALGSPQSLEKAVAEGNVGVVREVPGANGAPPSRSVGRADMAIYTPGDGNVELRGTPRVQSGPNTHVATSPDTVMLLENGGQLITKGPSRTEIRQQPKTAASPATSPAAKP